MPFAKYYYDDEIKMIHRHRNLISKSEEKISLEELGIDGRTLLKCKLNKWGVCVDQWMDQYESHEETHAMLDLPQLG